MTSENNPKEGHWKYFSYSLGWKFLYFSHILGKIQIKVGLSCAKLSWGDDVIYVNISNIIADKWNTHPNTST